MKINRDKLKKIPKKCILDENKICDNCCECFLCDLDPTKECDGCGKCLDLAKFNDIPIEDLLLNDSEDEE